MKYTLHTRYQRLLADTLTPVSIYLKVRDKFANPILLESSDYHGNDNSWSFICFAPIAQFKVQQDYIHQTFPDGQSHHTAAQLGTVMPQLYAFAQSFEMPDLGLPFPHHGLFGYTTFDAVRYFEDLEMPDFADDRRAIPAMWYQVYRFVIAINHFNEELYLFEHTLGDTPSRLDEVRQIITQHQFANYPFSIKGAEQSSLSDEAYRAMVEQGKVHCRRGDVFQIVLSRAFEQGFEGDEFNVYRALRSINPSPYLFFFDYGGFKIFGSSPEAQLVIKRQRAEIHPIAGTFRRTGSDAEDALIAQRLFADEKETAEHVMLVDLARNDLSRHGNQVTVETFKEIQYYSHLIHLVSKVTARVPKTETALPLFADTFPAGTLSGAPKYKALQLITRYEPQNRGFYGGAIGWMSFSGDLNHAIMIRSFLSKHNTLHYQAGAGVVSKSVAQSELEEVNHKLGALRKAIAEAERLL